MRNLLFAIPLGILVATRIFRIEPLKIRIKAVAGDKKRGIDTFAIATTIKNTGDLNLTINVNQFAIHTNTGKIFTIKTTTGISLPKGSEIRVPSIDFNVVGIPENAPLGIYNAVTEVTFDNKTIASVLSNAWNVVEPIKAAEIVRIEVR